MKKRIIRMIAFLLVTALVITPFPAKAMSTGKETEGGVTEVDYGDGVRIVAYEDDSGNAVIVEYQNGVVTQRNTVSNDGSGTIVREYYDDKGQNVVKSDILNAADVGTVSHEVERATYAAGAYSYFGEIQYKVVGYEGNEYYTQIVKLRSDIKHTTYTIDAWKGAVVDLVALFVSVGLGKVGFLNSFTKQILANAGIIITDGWITDKLTTTLSSTATEYTWQIYDSVAKNDAYAYGQKNVITETAHHTGEVYYDGIVPHDWGKSAMASHFYNANYTYSYWNVNSWYLFPENGYI